MKNFLSSVICHLSTERERLPLWIPVALGAGMAWYFSLLWEPSCLWLGIALAIAAALIYLSRHHFLMRLMSIGLGLMVLGALVAALRTHAISTPVIYGELYFKTVEGRIDDIHIKEKGRRLIIANPVIEGLPASRNPKRITVTLKKDDPGLAIGDRVRLTAMLFSLPAPAMPGSFDYARTLYFDGIGAVGFSPSLPVLIEKGEPNHFNEWLNALRLQLAERIAAPLSPENAPVAAALMVGEQSGVSQEVSDAMRDAGIYHVLSISGLHMSLAAGLIYFTVRLLLALYPPLALHLPTKKIAAAIGLICAFTYLLLAGYPVPAVRSFVMVACVMLAVLVDRRGISLYSLAWAAVMILLWQPESIFGASFQLSFAATLAILALYERFSPSVLVMQGALLYRLWFYFIGLTMTSLAATLVTTPLVIYHFNRFSVLGLLANTLMMPLASFWIMPAAVLAFLVMPLGLEHWPLVVLDYGITLMVAGAKWVAAFPAAAFFLPSLTTWGMVLAILGGLWLCLWQSRWRYWGVLSMLLGTATIMFHQPYDMLISDDATKVAQRQPDGEWLFLRGRPDSFDGEVWLHANGKEAGLSLSDRKPEGMICDEVKCIFTIAGRRVAVGKSKKKREGLCDTAVDMLISDAYLKESDCQHIAQVLDKNFLGAHGAVGVRFTATDIGIATANALRGNRPWVSRNPSFLRTQAFSKD